jgi:hypothetical protein
MNQAQKTVYEETLKGIGEGIEAMLDAAAEKPDSPNALLVGVLAMLCTCVTVGCERIALAIEESAP